MIQILYEKNFMKKMVKKLGLGKIWEEPGEREIYMKLLKTNFLIVKSILMRKKHPNMTS